MAIIETPGLLVWWEESDYLARYKEIFDGHNEIIIPECPDKKIIVYTRKDGYCKHFWRWWKDKDWTERETRQRAYRIWRIKYMIENEHLRTVYLDTKTNNIVFTSTELAFAIVIDDLWNKFKLVTSFTVSNPYRREINDRYTEYVFEK